MTLHFERDSCNEEEEYQPIPKREEEEETTDPEYKYDTPMTPRTSLEVRSKKSSPSRFVNTSNTNCGNNGQGSLTSQKICLIVPRTNIMAGNDIKLLIFNENGLEYLEQHWFLCEVVWTMQLVQDEAIKKD